jgi:NhaA family Na+:H+ antiporter
MSDKQSVPDLAQPLERRFEQLTEQFNRFVSNQTSGAILLLVGTLAALVFANTPLHGLYLGLEKIEAGFFVQDFELRKTLHHWVNDGLMVLFFFLLGLEIKREFLVGELRSFSQSSTIIMAAAGGILFPALIYAAFNLNGSAAQGWGIPMATDAAFALGALVLLGRRIPAGLKVFLVALAIVDDIGAIIVIALFYTETLHLNMLWIATGLFGTLLLINRLGIGHQLPYLVISIGLWYAVLLSGIHATIAGVLAALAIPAHPRLHPWFLARKLRKAAKAMYEIDPRKAQN